MIAIKDDEFHRLTDYVKTHFGINLTKKRTLIEGRLNNILLEKGCSSFGEYLERVFADKTGRELKVLINKLTTNHTFFMRESSHFDFFRDAVLPPLIACLKDRDLRIWCAGCSTGEEAYTLQMIIHDLLDAQISQWDTKLLATDISERALQIAAQGVYPENSMAELPPMWKLKYFDKAENGRVCVKEDIRRDILFRSFNLMEPFPFRRKFHVIFCRNVMIYFDREAKNDLIRKFYDIMEEGGYLFIGHSESIDRSMTKFKYVMPAVYRKG